MKKLYEEFKLYENMWDSAESVNIREDWYGAESEVEFDESVYGDIAKYFGLSKDDTVYYAYYFLDAVIVNYTDVNGRDCELEKHIPIDQVEEWFKAGYTILDENRKAKKLQETRSVADIEADIARLQAELANAKVAEKKASYGGNLPTYVWYWDMYLDPSEKGTWTSIENDTVFETEDAALDGAYTLLGELDDEGELEYDSDEYYVDAIKIPISKVDPDILESSGLGHLI